MEVATIQADHDHKEPYAAGSISPALQAEGDADADRPGGETGEALSCSVKVKFAQEKYAETWRFAPSWTLDDLILRCADTWPGTTYDWERAKFLVERRRPDLKGGDGVLKAQQDGGLGLAPLDGNALRILAPRRAAVESLEAAGRAAAAQEARRAQARARARAQQPAARRTRRSGGGGGGADPLADAQYTFHTIRPLPHLPGPERSRAFLERLRDDPGIRAAMRAHRFSVGLLTEMDPASYTQASHEGTTRVLGLNRNKGEAIELRLRTDAYDGYRDYGTIRKTLCHELAHNVHGPHDRAFWDLCHQIEREVQKADWTSGGRTVGDEEFAPGREGEGEDVAVDHGGWEGGEFVLGGGNGGGLARTEGLSRREIMARAAEERTRKIRRAEDQQGKQAGGTARHDGEGEAS